MSNHEPIDPSRFGFGGSGTVFVGVQFEAPLIGQVQVGVAYNDDQRAFYGSGAANLIIANLNQAYQSGSLNLGDGALTAVELMEAFGVFSDAQNKGWKAFVGVHSGAINGYVEDLDGTITTIGGNLFVGGVNVLVPDGSTPFTNEWFNNTPGAGWEIMAGSGLRFNAFQETTSVVLIDGPTREELQLTQLASEVPGLFIAGDPSTGELAQYYEFLDGDGTVPDPLSDDHPFRITATSYDVNTTLDDIENGAVGAGNVVVDGIVFADNSTTTTHIDPLNTSAWDTHTTATDSFGNTTADLYDYSSTTELWFTTHSIEGIDFGGYDEAEASNFFASTEYGIYAGDWEAGGIPGVFSFEPGNSPAFDFTTGFFNIDSGGFSEVDNNFFTTVDLVEYDWDNYYEEIWDQDWGDFNDFDFSFDTSGINASYDDWAWEDDQYVYDTYTYDDWSYGDWFEPVILDLDGDGIDITPRDNSSAYFDIDGDEFDERVAWVGPGDGILVLNDTTNDLPSGVVVDYRHEIVFSTDPSQTDMEALHANHDTNGNNVLDSGDARWNDFLIWIDRNGDGYSDPDHPETPGIDENEIFTLAELDIASIGLVSDNASFLLPDNSLIHGFSSFTYGDGTSAAAADVALSYDPNGVEIEVDPGVNFGGITYEEEVGGVIYILAALHWFPNGLTNPSAYFEPNNIALPSGFNGFIGGELVDKISVADNNLDPGGLWFDGAQGDDVIVGGIGDDDITGSEGLDILHGGAGDDTIYFDANELSLVVSADVFQYDDPVNPIVTAGSQYIDGGNGYDTGILTSTTAISINLSDHGLEGLIASFGNDTITAGDTAAANIDGRGGNDSITGGLLADILAGGIGDDTINAGDGGDFILAGAGNDSVAAGTGDDNIFGGDGDDTLDGGAGVDTIDGGEGIDTASYATAAGGIEINLGSGGASSGGAAGDTFISIENIIGTDYVDCLTGDTGANNIDGGGGIDNLYGQLGDDVVDGGLGDDIVFGDFSTYFMQTAKFAPGTIFGNDTLRGGIGKDTLNGGNGADRLDGGEGNDLLIGGAKTDVFAFSNDWGADIVSDFDKDTIDFSGNSTVNNFSDLTITYGNGDATIATADGSITLSGVSAGLTVDDFQF